MSMRKGSVAFQPRARLVKLLGEELITNEIIALVELVKNSYDADSTEVLVKLEGVTDTESGKIIVKDNGTGMSLAMVLEAWLQPGTEIKKRRRERNERSLRFHRPILGEKGVGRFAAQKLGALIDLTTRAKGDKFETLVEINWRQFEQDKPLSEVKVNWVQTKPKFFRESQTGTLIEMGLLHKKWNRRMVSNLAQKLAGLQSPFSERENFIIEFISDDFPDIEKEVKFPKKILKRAVYSFSGDVSDEGDLTAKYKFKNPVFPNLQRDENIDRKNIRGLAHFRIGTSFRKPRCGPFHFELYVWDLDPATLNETISKKIYRDYVQPHTGISIYRDDFRIWPYGEEGNDWLDLNKRRVNNPPKCLSNNQIIGIVEVSHETNPSLRDKTDREGLIENEGYRDFKSLVITTMNQLEILRRQDKTKIDNMRERKIGKKIDETLNEIQRLRRKISKNKHDDLYMKHTDSIERAHLKYREEIVERLYVAAGIGIAALMPAHEVQLQLKDLRPILKSIKEDTVRLGLGGRITERFADIDRILGIMWEVSEGALELTKRELKTFSLRSIVDFSIKNKQQEFERNRINVIIDEKENIEIKGYQNLAMTVIMNLLDNSIWWLQQRTEDKLIKVTIKRDLNYNPNIIISDNGSGIDPVDLPYLGDAFYTRKPRGTGLGLYISKRCMESNNGRIEFGFYPNDPDFLEGANVIMVFKGEGEKE